MPRYCSCCYSARDEFVPFVIELLIIGHEQGVITKGLLL